MPDVRVYLVKGGMQKVSGNSPSFKGSLVWIMKGFVFCSKAVGPKASSGYLSKWTESSIFQGLVGFSESKSIYSFDNLVLFSESNLDTQAKAF